MAKRKPNNSPFYIICKPHWTLSTGTVVNMNIAWNKAIEKAIEIAGSSDGNVAEIKARLEELLTPIP